MAAISEVDLLTTSEYMTDEMNEVVHQNSSTKEKMFESCESTASLEAHESGSSLEVEPIKGDKHIEQGIGANKSKVPEVGQIFASEEVAYQFYNAYSRKEGFLVRKNKIERRSNGKIYVRHFTCSKEGHRKKDHRRINVKKRRAESRTGCMARLVIRLNDDDTWVVKEFVADHNHPKANLSKPLLLRAVRRLQPSHVARLIDFEDVGLPLVDGIEVLAKEARKMFESCESTASLEAHESVPSLEGEPSKGDKHVDWEIDANKSKVPELGQVFASEDVAYKFYNAYGRKEGFRVRKNKIDRKSNGKIYVRHFTCSKEGHRKMDRRRINVKKRRAETRTGCMARLVIKLNDDDTWVVKEFIADHNHPKATPSETHLLNVQRLLQLNHVARIIGFEDAGMPSADSIDEMTKETRGNENHGISELDYRNFLPTMKTMKKNQLGKEEAQRLMDYFRRMQLENPSFFYAVQVNSVHEITNFFWVDGRSIMDYKCFGDVVCFDTTYRTNKHSWPFAPFIGVNHHRQTILFGAALMFEETTDSFVWLFETFLEAMSGLKPITILTDQCAATAKAINIVMSDTHHRICLRHVFQNGAIYLPRVYKDSNFSIDFKKCIYNGVTEEAFLLEWSQMLEKHGLVGDKWLEGLFEFREKWALVYGRNVFCADMATTQRSENISCMLKKFLERKLSLPEVVLCYEKLLASMHAKELKADFDSCRASLALYINAPMLKQVAKEYTREAFEMFQKEFEKFLLYNVEDCGVDGTIQKYKVTKIDAGEECLVTLDAPSHEVLCSCKKFEFTGIQCKHVIKVFNFNNIHVVPSQYILKRWTKDARVGVVNNNVENQIQAKPKTGMELRYANIYRAAVNLAIRGAVSEDAYLMAITSLEKALGDVDDILKGTQMVASYDSFSKMNDGECPLNVTLTLAQGNEMGGPSFARMKSSVIGERARERVRKRINLHGDNWSNQDQPKPKKRREGKRMSVDEGNNDPLVNPSHPEVMSTQVPQIFAQESDHTYTFQEPCHANGLQQSSFQPSLRVLPQSFPMPVSFTCIPSIAPHGGTPTAHIKPIRPADS